MPAAVSMPDAACLPACVSLRDEPPHSLLPTILTSAPIGWRSAFCTTSGPIPRGSPTATARRGRGGFSGTLEPDVDVRLTLQLVDEMADRQLIAERLPDAQLHVFIGELARSL